MAYNIVAMQYQQYQQQQYQQQNPMYPQQHQQQQMMPQQAPQMPQITLILYYKSKNCNNSQKIINHLRQYGEIMQTVQFICLDNYYRNAQGEGCTQLQNGMVVKVYPQINRTPALVAINQQTSQPQFIFGNEIATYFEQYVKYLQQQATKGNDSVYEFTGFEGTGGVVSDSYAVLSEINQQGDLDIAPDKRDVKPAQLHMYDSLDSNANVGLLGQPVRDIKDNPDPWAYMTKDQMAQGTQYNQNQFRIERTVQTPSQFPTSQFLEGQMQFNPAQRQGMSAASGTYNGNEFMPQPPGGGQQGGQQGQGQGQPQLQMPAYLRTQDTPNNKRRDNVEELAMESAAMIQRLQAEREAIANSGPRGGQYGGQQQQGPKQYF